MKFRLISALALLLGWLSACSSVTVQEKAGVDYTQYRTFAWADTEVKTDGTQGPALRSQLQDGVLRPAIEAELAKRGITPATTGRPDLYLTYHLYVEEAERTVANPPNPAVPVSYPYLVRYRGALIPVNYTYWYQAPSGYRTETYQEGMLVLDFIDAKSNNMIWRGSVSDAVSNPARAGERFAESARDILDKFPVKQQK
ncbi:DUF4136 domain-containing protein [Hymenobacter gummosus]|uniref:DUF4136 domain-containing protein n=1 Tax=Hymenobacter gummosus TaxID=1776032 RepID=A0A3S0INF3_9BACT|nr:DUF4136 domain-containing protein [Hymenobacter gummosus]RTQ49653.1 DUF4136 domain-containing protein [Hymenobacter gummosus]